MANADWEQLVESAKSKKICENFVRDTAKTHEKAKRSDYVRAMPHGGPAPETRVEKGEAKEGE
jgi:hypothetical protein